MEINRSGALPIQPPRADKPASPSAPSSSNSSAQRPVAGVLGGLRDIGWLPPEVMEKIAGHADAKTRKSIRLAGNDRLGLTLKDIVEVATQSVKVNNRTDLATDIDIS